MTELLEQLLAPHDVIPAPWVSQMLRTLGLPKLHTRALTDAMSAAGFERIDRPRLGAMVNSAYRGRRFDTRSWPIPGVGHCTVYVRNTAGDAETMVRKYGQNIPIRGHAARVFQWLDTFPRKPDGRQTRFEDKPGRRTLARLAMGEILYHAKRSAAKGGKRGPARATICRVCGVNPPTHAGARCKECLLVWRRAFDYPAQRIKPASDASAPVIPLGRKRALARQTARIESERQVAEGRAFAADLARRRAAGEAIPPPVKPYWVSDNDT